MLGQNSKIVVAWSMLYAAGAVALAVCFGLNVFSWLDIAIRIWCGQVCTDTWEGRMKRHSRKMTGASQHVGLHEAASLRSSIAEAWLESIGAPSHS